MENLGKVLKLKETTVSVHQTAEYQKLMTQDDEEDNEDDVLFIKKNVKSKNKTTIFRNKKKESNVDTSPKQTNNDMNGVIFENVTRKQSQLLPTSRTSWVLIIFITFTSLALVLLRVFNSSFTPLNWSHEMQGFETTSNNMVFADVDGDGLDDVVVFVSASTNQSTSNCSSSDSCGGKMMALRGVDGLILWSATLTYQIVDLKCGMKGEERRCVGVVEGGRLVSIDVATGEVLWLVGHQLEGRWAGSCVVENNDHLLWFLMQKNNFRDGTANRSAVVVVDTLTGMITSHPYYFPLSHWLSFSPTIIIDIKEKEKYLLFGLHDVNSTSEVRLIKMDIFDEIMKNNLSQKIEGTLLLKSANDCHTTQPAYFTDEDNIVIFLVSCHANITRIKLKSFLTTKERGAFKLEISWNKTFSHYSSQGKAVTGYFNGDLVKDLFVPLVKKHNQPSNLPDIQHVVLNGRNGEVLWSETSSHSNAYDTTHSSVYNSNEKELLNKITIATKSKQNLFLYWKKNITEYDEKMKKSLEANLKGCSGSLNRTKRSIDKQQESNFNKSVLNGSEANQQKTNKYSQILNKLHRNEDFLDRRRTHHDVVEENSFKSYDFPLKPFRQRTFVKPRFNDMTFGELENLKNKFRRDYREYSYNDGNYEYDYGGVGEKGFGRRWRWYDGLKYPAARRQRLLNLAVQARKKELMKDRSINPSLTTKIPEQPATSSPTPSNTVTITPTTNAKSVKCSPMVSSYSLWGVSNNVHLPILETWPLPRQLIPSFLVNSHQQSLSNLSPSTNHTYCTSFVTTDVTSHFAHLDGGKASLVTVHTVNKASHDQNGIISRVFKKVVISKTHPASSYDPTYGFISTSDATNKPEKSFCEMVSSSIYKMLVSAKSLYLPYTSHLFQSSFFSPSLPQFVRDSIDNFK